MKIVIHKHIHFLPVGIVFLFQTGLLECAEKYLTLEQAQNTIGMYCAFCHNDENPQAGLNLVSFQSTDDIVQDMEEWNTVMRRLEAHEMPPKDALQPGMDERQALIGWIHHTMQEAICADGIDPGPSPIRRLNRNEYSNTIRDLFDIHFNAGHNLPSEGAGGAGFDNAAEALFISPVHAERYLESAKEVLDYAAKDITARDFIFFVRPEENRTAEEAARQVLERFASRAFRRPAALEELAQLMSLFRSAMDRGENFEASVLYAMQAVLISPHFLFLVEEPNLSPAPKPISGYELANRLSYFLWASAPDEELLRLAKEGCLHEERTLLDQVDRLLDAYKNAEMSQRRSDELEDRKYYEFADSFISQWLGTRELGRDIKPDTNLFPRYNQELEFSMQWEPVYLFQYLVQENMSLLHLIDTDFTYVNRDLARLYGIDKQVKIENDQLLRTTLPEGSHRGGIVTMAGVLAVSSYPTRTSPVLRGKWVLETLLGTPPPPPPPNVPDLEENKEGAAPKTLRERLEMHRENPVCASCHDRIDPIGFGLENFDPIGQWREEDAGKPVDSSGTLPNGASFQGPEELKQIIMERRDDFIRHLSIKMLGYALGRSIVTKDYCTVDHIVEQLKRNDYRAKTLIYEIVKSIPFRYHQANEEPIEYPVIMLMD